MARAIKYLSYIFSIFLIYSMAISFVVIYYFNMATSFYIDSCYALLDNKKELSLQLETKAKNYEVKGSYLLNFHPFKFICK